MKESFLLIRNGESGNKKSSVEFKRKLIKKVFKSFLLGNRSKLWNRWVARRVTRKLDVFILRFSCWWRLSKRVCWRKHRLTRLISSMGLEINCKIDVEIYGKDFYQSCHHFMIQRIFMFFCFWDENRALAPVSPAKLEKNENVFWEIFTLRHERLLKNQIECTNLRKTASRRRIFILLWNYIIP